MPFRADRPLREYALSGRADMGVHPDKQLRDNSDKIDEHDASRSPLGRPSQVHRPETAAEEANPECNNERPNTGAEPPEYDENEKDRLWEHRLHEDLLIYERHNFFLVAESLLVVAYAQLLGDNEDLAAAILAGAGMLLTVAWLRVGYRARQVSNAVHGRARETLREFNDTWIRRPPRGRLGGTGKILDYFVPGLLIGIWGPLLIVALS